MASTNDDRRNDGPRQPSENLLVLRDESGTCSCNARERNRSTGGFSAVVNRTGETWAPRRDDIIFVDDAISQDIGADVVAVRAFQTADILHCRFHRPTTPPYSTRLRTTTIKERLRSATTSLEILLYSRQYIRLLDHQVEFIGLAIRRHLVMEVEPPTEIARPFAPGSHVCVPILMPARGETVANLRARDTTQHRVHILTHQEQVDLTREILLAQLAQAQEAAGITLESGATPGFNIAKAIAGLPEASVKSAALSRDLLTNPDLHIPASRPDWQAALTTIGQARDVVKRSKALHFLITLLASQYLLFAECRVGDDGRVVLEFSFDTDYAEGGPHRDDPSRETLRRILGLRAPNYAFYLGRGPTHVQTFHFRIGAPRGHCISLCSFRKIEGDLPAAEALKNKVDSLPALDADQASVLAEHVNKFLPYADIVCAGSKEDNVTTLASVHMRERPPGTVGRALLVSIISLFPLGVVAAIFHDIFSGHSTLNAELPAFLVGIPGFAALAMGPHRDGRSLSATPITSYMARLLTALIALIAALDVLVTQVENGHVVFHNMPVNLSFVVVGQAVMIGLFVLQGLITYVVRLRYLLAARYLHGGVANFTPPWPYRLVLKCVGRRLRRLLIAGD